MLESAQRIGYIGAGELVFLFLPFFNIFSIPLWFGCFVLGCMKSRALMNFFGIPRYQFCSYPSSLPSTDQDMDGIPPQNTSTDPCPPLLLDKQPQTVPTQPQSCLRTDEASSKLTKKHTGIQVSPNSSRILRKLGVDRYIERCCTEPIDLRMMRWRDGKVLVECPLKEPARKAYGSPYWYVVLLHSHLADCSMHTDESFSDFGFTLESCS